MYKTLRCSITTVLNHATHPTTLTTVTVTNPTDSGISQTNPNLCGADVLSMTRSGTFLSM